MEVCVVDTGECVARKGYCNFFLRNVHVEAQSGLLFCPFEHICPL
ncbi:MAG: hypothetical protein ACI92E_002432 [Oceanicoccus sp.]|jgi:hypothetical protein